MLIILEIMLIMSFDYAAIAAQDEKFQLLH
jgi:hypothetical protein